MSGEYKIGDKFRVSGSRRYVEIVAGPLGDPEGVYGMKYWGREKEKDGTLVDIFYTVSDYNLKGNGYEQILPKFEPGKYYRWKSDGASSTIYLCHYIYEEKELAVVSYEMADSIYTTALKLSKIEDFEENIDG